MTEPAALVFEDRHVCLPELDAFTDSLAATLRKRGVDAGQRVALMASNRPEFIAAVHAIWRVGAAAVLISPAWKRDEVEHALALTGPVDALGDHPVLAGLMPMLHLDEPLAPAEPVGAPVSSQADAVLVFSSGTTGLPKAVRHTHASLNAAVRQWRDALGLTERDRLQVTTPPSHILGLLNILTALRTGARVRLHPRFNIDRMLRHIETDRITVEMAVAPIALALASHPDLESYDLSSLRYIMWGATPVTDSIAETVTRRTGVGWVPAYGTTELPVIACNPLTGARLDSVGRAVPGVQLRVVSMDTGEPQGPGHVGEIQARADSLMAGYLPAASTADVCDDGWYRTGDVGWLDADGWLRITDRLKEMIKVRGFQVAPAEIETVLHGHPAVKDCAVFGVPDGANGEAVVAAIATRIPVDAEELIARVDAKLATYKRLSRVVFVTEIPRLPSGKVLRRVLKESYGCTSDC
ncbi:class I adenylate-forming enzyme family protein [Mycobacterium sp. TY814]|uniref:class I adenylate-forming enzyme family protein n=1 Tax=unclassified Mycobacterium TaxID=2642494 RepID=UPI00274045F1|nr:class I adenylate-forming enzyme family protein [Mycobacterium sp. TY814]MDP7726369.1 class I adenylate-forming enzyme family protein [Mycobacterium sp. TY814]